MYVSVKGRLVSCLNEEEKEERKMYKGRCISQPASTILGKRTIQGTSPIILTRKRSIYM